MDASGLVQIKILLVDDREENLLTLEAILSSPDYKIIKANSGDMALRYLLDHEPALILMDVQMPNLSGFETASILKKSERTREIPIIFVSADSAERFVHQGYEYGAVDYISKPFDIQIMKSKVAVFADLYRKTQRILKTEKLLHQTETRERERKLAELELRSLKREQVEQKKYRDLVEGIEQGIVWSASPETMTFSFVSATAERILGFAPIVWQSEFDFWNNHIHPEDKKTFHDACQKALREKIDVGVDHRFIKSNGQVAWLHTGMRLSQNGENIAAELRGLSIDITRLKETESILERNKKNSDFLARASLLLSASFEYEKTIVELGEACVPEFSDVFIVDLLEENGKVKNLTTVTNGNNSLERANTLRKKFILEQKPSIPRKSELYSESHKELRTLGLRSAILSPLKIRGTQIGFLALASETRSFDAEELFVAEDLAMRIATAVDNSNLFTSAQAAVRLRDDFLSVASHELKTPLTPLQLSIQGIMRMMNSKLDPTVQAEKMHKMLDRSNRQIDKLNKLIDNLLDISRISIGKLSINLEEFDLVRVLHDVVQRFSEQLAQAKCEIKLETPDRLLVQLDPLRMEQIIVNLLTNAWKYAPGKPIHISLSSNDAKIRLSVKDHGVGIAKADQSRIFERFERAATLQHLGGLGLGLYIVSQVIEAHGGKIHVESEVGAGSTFIVEIPQNISQDKFKITPTFTAHTEISQIHQ